MGGHTRFALPGRGHGRAAGGLVTAAALTAGVLASLGAGYTVAKTTLSDGSAYVAKGTTVVHANGVSGSVDATADPVAVKGQRVDVTTLPGNTPVAVNNDTGKVTTLDGATMTPTSTVSTAGSSGAAGPLIVVASGDHGWLVDHDGSSATVLADGRRSTSVKVPSPPVDAAPGPDGSVVVLGSDGRLTRVDTSGRVRPIDADPAATGALTVADGHTYLVTGDGKVLRVDDGAPDTVASVAAPASGRVIAGSVDSPGKHVLFLNGAALEIVDPASGDAHRISLHTGSGDVLGRPVEFAGKAYVPDYTTHQVLQIDESSQRVEKKLSVPQGGSPTFALFVSGDKLWANDQYAQHLLVVDGSGRTGDVDKGAGNGVGNQNGPSGGRGGSTTGTATPPATPPASTPPATTPPASAPPASTPPAGTPPAGSSGDQTPKTVTVPTFPSGTNWNDACAQIRKLGPDCTGVSGGTDGDGDSGDVISTVPGGGDKVSIDGSVAVSYVGDVEVPKLPDDGPTTPAQQCVLVSAAKLDCDPQPSSTPATDINQYGTVSGTSPTPGGSAKKGDKVIVYYYDSYPMPDAVGPQSAGAEVCAQITALTLSLPSGTTHPGCTSTPGDAKTNDSSKVGKTYQQSIRAGTAVHASDTPVLTVYKGDVPVPDWANTPDSDGTGLATTGEHAQQDCLTTFSGCSIQVGSPAVDNPALAGRVQSSSPAAGTAAAVGSAVTITVWNKQNTVPPVEGMSTTDACAKLQAAKFGCKVDTVLVRVDAANVNHANPGSQSPAGNTAADMGTVVTIQTTPWAAYPLYAYEDNDQVQVPRLNAPAPTNFGAQRLLGYAYAVGSGIPTGAVAPNEWQCNGGKDACNGHDLNHQWTAAPDKTIHDNDGQAWDKQGPIADLIPPSNGACGQGQNSVWRTFRFSGKTHTYSIDINQTAATNNELLGCVWAG